MNKSIVIRKEADAKKSFSSAHKSDKSIHRIRDEPDRQLVSLGGVIGNIGRDGAAPSAESIATELGGRSAAERAPALLALQQTHGNRYVQRVVAGIQAKLTVGQPGDKYEQEADRVADTVMRMPEPEVQRQPEEEEEEEEIQTKSLAEEITPLVQRQVEPEEEEEETAQAKGDGGNSPAVSPSVESGINTIRGGGSPLPESSRAFFEPRFSADFSGVKVHTDSNAAHIARSVNAKAFTVGRDVIFGSGQFSPETTGGKKLLAHELTHVVQQNGGPTLFSDKGKERWNMAPTTGRAVSEQDRVQMVPSLQMVGPAAPVLILGLTIAELTAIVGTVTGVAAAVGMAAQNQGKTGKGGMMKLKFSGNYLMTPVAKAQLENISRVLFLLEVEKLTAAKVSKGNKKVIRETAIGNTKIKVIDTLDKCSVVKEEYGVANGDGGRTKSYEPWGAAKIRMDGGYVFPWQFDRNITTAAKQHGVTIKSKDIEFIKSFTVDYDYKSVNHWYSTRDDIYVRGHSMEHLGTGGNIKVLCSVAFDWDDDTTYLEWKGSNAIVPGWHICSGTWVGPRNPDD